MQAFLGQNAVKWLAFMALKWVIILSFIIIIFVYYSLQKYYLMTATALQEVANQFANILNTQSGLKGQGTDKWVLASSLETDDDGIILGFKMTDENYDYFQATILIR